MVVKPKRPARHRVLVGEGGNLREGLQVLDDHLADARPLNLDRDPAPVAQGRAVHLAQRGRRHRLRLELGEGLGEPDAQLRADDGLHVHERERLDLVLEPGQRFHVGEGKDVGARGEELAELDEGRPHLLEIGGKMLGELLFAGSDHRRVGDRLIEAGALHEVGPPVLHEESGDVLVALEVLALQ
jgi:hypothetical protein